MPLALSELKAGVWKARRVPEANTNSYCICLVKVDGQYPFLTGTIIHLFEQKGLNLPYEYLKEDRNIIWPQQWEWFGTVDSTVK